MAIICWGNLAKSGDDTTRVEQSIHHYVQTHDENPNAHMGEDYALGVHRLQAVIDHAPYSIFNANVYPQVRSYKAIVDPAGNGDIKTIQGAIDYVNGLGGGQILIKAGIYTLSESLTLYDNIKLRGESRKNTILDFDNNAKRIQATGKADILISELTVKNSDVTDDLGAIYFNNCDDSQVDRCSFVDNNGGGSYDIDICFYECTRCDATNNETSGSGGLARVYQGTKCTITENYVGSATKDAILLQSGTANRASKNFIAGSDRNGIVMDAGQKSFINENRIEDWGNGAGISIGNAELCAFCVINSNSISGGTSGGPAILLHAKDNQKIVISGNYAYTDTGDAIEINSGSERTTVVGNMVWTEVAGKYGVNIKSGAVRTLVVGNSSYGPSGDVLDNGTDSVVASNV